MALALCLLFDSRSERLIRGLWERLEGHGIPTLLTHTHRRHHPHLSYAVLLDAPPWDIEAVSTAVTALPTAGPMEVHVQGTVVFPRGRAALACSVSAGMAARQERAAEALMRTGALLHRHYEPGRWVPHVSVATSAPGAALPVVVGAVSDALPVTLRAERAALIDSSSGRMWPLEGIP